MCVWAIKTGLSDQVATLAVPEADQVIGSMKRFGGDGSPLQWSEPQRLEPLAEKRRTPKPFGDISPFLPGALVLSARAYEALGPFLSKFGQLLELDVAGQVRYFFNVTNLVSCIDRERSERRPGGVVGKEAFIAEALPIEPAVFKDPTTARSRLYVNDAGKRALEEAAAPAEILGLLFVRAGL